MLKIWVHSTNQSSYYKNSWGSIPIAEIIRLIYSIAFTSYFILNLAKQSANANLVPEEIAVDLSISVKNSLPILPNKTISQGEIFGSTEKSLTKEQECLLDLKTKLDNKQSPPKRFTRAASISNLTCGLESENSFPTKLSIEPVVAPLTKIEALTNLLSIVPSKPLNRPPIVLPNAQAIPNPVKDPRYQIAPRSVNLGKLNPALTQIVVNDVPLTHRSQLEVTGGTEIGDRSTTNPALNATALNSPEASESVSSNRVYRTEYRSNYSQARTIRQERNITTAVESPETAFGFRQQISFVGDCINGVPSPTGVKQICSYLPGLKTDESSIDPKTLIPRRILQTSQFGEIVTPASRVAITAPGFQGGANGQLLGLDLYFPRVGTEAGNTQGNERSFDRFESTTTVPTISFGRINQVILANGRETAIGRTIRGTNYVFNDRNTGWMAGIQAATELLPNVEPFLPSGKKGGSVEIDRSLLLAANNNRIPENSFTSYYSGIGSGFTPTDSRATTSNYRGIWVGFSPVVDRQVSSSTTLQSTGAERTVLSAGGEGGVDTDTNVTALLNQNNFNSSTISNAYVQTYLTRYERDISTRNSTIIRERTDYQPHLSATGNVTTPDSVFRYYSGVIFNPNKSSDAANTSKAYIGIDYTKVEERGFSYNIAAIGYANPDPEYYSKITLNVNKQIPLGKNPAYSLGISGGINYVLDGAKVFDAVNFRSAASFMNVGARANLGNVSVGATYFVETNMPNSLGNLLSTSASWKISSGLTLSGYYTPTNDNAARSPFGASANIRLGNNPASPTLSLSWNRNEIDLGVDSNNNRAGVTDNVFAAYLRFDAPLNSFR
jgi:hypothetical protein